MEQLDFKTLVIRIPTYDISWWTHKTDAIWYYCWEIITHPCTMCLFSSLIGFLGQNEERHVSSHSNNSFFSYILNEASYKMLILVSMTRY